MYALLLSVGGYREFFTKNKFQLPANKLIMFDNDYCQV